jgi:hypothetical protein
MAPRLPLPASGRGLGGEVNSPGRRINLQAVEEDAASGVWGAVESLTAVV